MYAYTANNNSLSTEEIVGIIVGLCLVIIILVSTITTWCAVKYYRERQGNSIGVILLYVRKSGLDTQERQTIYCTYTHALSFCTDKTTIAICIWKGLLLLMDHFWSCKTHTIQYTGWRVVVKLTMCKLLSQTSLSSCGGLMVWSGAHGVMHLAD